MFPRERVYGEQFTKSLNTQNKVIRGKYKGIW